ncbi:uncharacterized protein MELLADRAFT_75439 [Melampsora larici-populina 98AG31]|uniref:Uncharacterized protein n=2 Tax=Melampsora larici-populina (strain 98AG31 / pathotype 3-4-7) TaxID=747676 RepID=F4RY76_MELLP|nr:uncharacterized protein MELLADRAFT_75439 [Melampsora larici-populina 98AG31]EGG02685.1 hypothetical protein MELLADRAFT_75439 [Melampsora larici-populina 98AG31]
MADSSDSSIDPNALAQAGLFDASALFGPSSPQGRASPIQSDHSFLTSSTFNETADLLGMTEEYRNLASRIISKSTPENQYENYICLSTSILQAVRSRPSNLDESTVNKRQKLSWEPSATYVDWLNAIT